MISNYTIGKKVCYIFLENTFKQGYICTSNVLFIHRLNFRGAFFFVMLSLPLSC